MRLIFQASALLLAIAVFPLPTNTGIALPTFSLHDIISKSKQKPVAQPSRTDQAAVSAQPSPARSMAAELAAAQTKAAAATTAGSAANGVIVVQTDIPAPEPQTTALKRSEKAPEPAPSRTTPIKPQAVIATDFEHGGLSEASFRTVARVGGSEEPPEEKVLVIGDSLSIPLGKQLEEYFAQLPGIHFKRLGKVSSGLARPDFFDWEKTLASLADAMKPSTAVIMIGTNDNQSLTRSDGSTAHFGAGGWQNEYTRRIERIFALLHNSNPDVKIFWVGAPIMGRADLRRDVSRINRIIGGFCEQRENCHFIDTWDVLADDKGRFTNFLVDNTGERVRVRADDGVHLSHSGARILAGRCLQAMIPNLAVLQALDMLKPSG